MPTKKIVAIAENVDIICSAHFSHSYLMFQKGTCVSFGNILISKQEMFA